MSIRLTFLFIFLIFACTSPNRKVIGPDGTEYIKIECVDLEDCYRRADEKCPHHRQVNASSDSGETLKAILIQCE
jgi:hypothetical protein